MASLRDKTIKGVFWTSCSQGGTLILMLLYNIVMARLLVPADFGIVGMALLFTSLITVLFSLGLGTAIIQNQDIGQKTYSTVFWINLSIGWIAAIIVFSFSSVVGDYFGQPNLTNVLRFMSINFLFGSFSSVPIGLLSKRMQFKKQGIATLLSMAISFPFGVICAYFGHGYWSIVYANTFQILLASLFVWKASGWTPSLYFSIESVKPIFGFGIYKSVTAVASFFIRNIDYFIIGKVLGAEALGIYTIAFTLARSPAQKIRNIIGLVAFPAFAQIQGELERLRRNYYNISRIVILILLPISLTLLLFAKEFIQLLYGEKWIQSIPIVQILVLYTVMKGIGHLTQAVLMSLGKAKYVFYLFITESLILACLAYSGVRYGLNGVAVAVVVSAALVALIEILVLRQCANIQIFTLLQNLAMPISINAITFITISKIKNAYLIDVSSIYLLAIYVLSTVFVYFVVEAFILKTHERKIIKDAIFENILKRRISNSMPRVEQYE